MNDSFFEINNQKTSIIATAIHDGHYIKESLRQFMRLTEQQRSREEDPYTAYMISTVPTTTVNVKNSRFQLDLNRTKEKAIYEKPEDAWGLDVWNTLPWAEKNKLHNDYETFYKAMSNLLEETILNHGYFLVLDVHSYNHRRENAFTEADPATHPEINLGTAYNNDKWKGLCEAYKQFFGSKQINNVNIDARENIIFKGGAFAQWIIKNYGSNGCVISIEFKKTFMDEWTGVANIPHINQLQQLVTQSFNFLGAEIEKYL